MTPAIAEQLSQGVNLLVLGMGTVFVFLAILVISVQMMSRFSAWIESKNPAPPEETGSRPAQQPSGVPMAAITAAVHRYRQDHPS